MYKSLGSGILSINGKPVFQLTLFRTCFLQNGMIDILHNGRHICDQPHEKACVVKFLVSYGIL